MLYSSHWLSWGRKESNATMKHVRLVTKTPAFAGDVPLSIIFIFIQQILTAFINLFQAKEMQEGR